MVIAVSVRTRGLSNLQNLTSVLPKNLREDVGEANYNYTVIVRDSLKKQLRMKSEEFDRKIYNGIKAKRQSKFTSQVTIVKEGFMLDGMRPHWVSLKLGRRITAWAMERFNKPFNELPRAIRVKAHPFINDGLRRARKRLTTELRKGVRKAFRRSRR
jgi:hypothetical protein